MKKQNVQCDCFDSDLKMLQYLQNEFLYRHAHYWDFLIKSFLLTITITVFPLMSTIFGMSLNTIWKYHYLIFPAVGAFSAIVCFFILRQEGIRVNHIHNEQAILNGKMQDRYQIKPYKNGIEEYKIILDNGEECNAEVYSRDSKHWHLSQILEICVVVFETIVVILTALIIIFTDKM